MRPSVFFVAASIARKRRLRGELCRKFAGKVNQRIICRASGTLQKSRTAAGDTFCVRRREAGLICAFARKMWEHARSGGDLRIRAQAVGGHVMQVYLRMRAQTMGGCVSFFAFSHALSGRAKTAQNDDVG